MAVGDKEMFVCDLYSGFTPTIGFKPSYTVAVVAGEGEHAEDKLHALRLAACWNACRGINPEAVPDLLRELKAVEWAGTTDAEEGGYVDCCPSCGGEESEGHHKGCTLAAALAKATKGATK